MERLWRIFRNIGLTAVGLFLSVICIYLLFGQDIDQSANRTLERERAHEAFVKQIPARANAIANDLKNERIAGGTMRLREIKTDAEIWSVPRADYVELIVATRRLLPPPSPDKPWPFDLTQADDTPIHYGLFASGKPRLGGEARGAEMLRFADEVRLIVEGTDSAARRELARLIEERRRYETLDLSDQEFLALALGVESLDTLFPHPKP